MHQRFPIYILLAILAVLPSMPGWAVEEDSAISLLRDLYDEGFRFSSPDDRFSLRINGAIQLRYTFMDFDDSIVGNESNYSNFYMRRARLYFRGHSFDPKLTYYIHLQLEPTRSINAHDLWLEYEFSDLLRLGAGRNKIAYGLTFLNSGLGLNFVERSVFAGETDIDNNSDGGPTYPGGGTERFALTWLADTGFATGGLTLYRSQGIQLRGNRGSGDEPTFEYQLGLWNGRSTTGNSNSTDDHLFSARIGYHPFGFIDWTRQGDGTFSESYKLSLLVSAYTASNDLKGYSERGYNIALQNRFRAFSADFEWGLETYDFDSLGQDLERTGWRAEFGYFAIPEKLEFVARYAEIQRLKDPTYATALASGIGVATLNAEPGREIGIEKRVSEITAGISWFPETWHRNKLQLDISRLEREFAADPNAVVGGELSPISKASTQEDLRVRILAQVVF